MDQPNYTLRHAQEKMLEGESSFEAAAERIEELRLMATV